MRATELFGEKARTFIEWIGGIDSNEGSKQIYSFKIVFKAQKFLSRPFTIDMVVRPEEPFWDGFDTKKDTTEELYLFREAENKWENWKPLFLGFEKIDKHILYGTTKVTEDLQGVEYYHQSGRLYIKDKLFNGVILDDFIRECCRKNITLTFHPEYEI